MASPAKAPQKSSCPPSSCLLPSPSLRTPPPTPKSHRIPQRTPSEHHSPPSSSRQCRRRSLSSKSLLGGPQYAVGRPSRPAHENFNLYDDTIRSSVWHFGFTRTPAIELSSRLPAHSRIVRSTGSTSRTSTPPRLNIVTGLPPSTPHSDHQRCFFSFRLLPTASLTSSIR